MTDRELLARIAASAGQKAGYKQLVRELSLGGGRERRLLLEHLARLDQRQCQHRPGGGFPGLLQRQPGVDD